MQRVLHFGLLLLLGACSAVSGKKEATNRWTDERLWPVLEAQEHRSTDRLCKLLTDSSAVVREAAALAFASIQDSASIPCLLKALDDKEVSVRATAAFALGFIADSATVQGMAEAAMNERDTTVQRAYMSASFIAMQRNGMLKDPGAIIYFLESSRGHEQLRAADALRRLPDSTLHAIATDYMALLGGDTPLELEAMLVRGLGRVHSDEALRLLRFSTDADKPAVIIASALRALGGLGNSTDDSIFFHWSGAGCVGQAALEVLRVREVLDGDACLRKASEEEDTLTCIALLGLAMRHGHAAAADSAQKLLPQARSPYFSADQISARIASSKSLMVELDQFLYFLGSDEHPVFRQACYQGALTIVRGRMTRARYASREAQYAELGAVLDSAILSGDPGLIASVAETLDGEEPDVIRMLFTPELERKALAPLQPIRDLETRMLIQKVVAKRDGLPQPAHHRPVFNHAIDPVKLRSLKQGQQYRIVTNKGEIVIATDVNECPGSSLAFDSLVTAGYYNGKYFHRMVPNFVVQGGCPRGDGYGGMPWTLRTEISRTPFTAGSVGLASSGPDTESCQFFITHSAAPHLDGRYTRFGQVLSGMDVIWELQVGDSMVRVERVN